MANTYRSGVVSVDSPYLENTQIYKDTYNKINNTQAK